MHHRRQIAASKVPRVTSVDDLAVVCATCHALIHANPRQATPVEGLREMLLAEGTLLA